MQAVGQEVMYGHYIAVTLYQRCISAISGAGIL